MGNKKYVDCRMISLPLYQFLPNNNNYDYRDIKSSVNI